MDFIGGNANLRPQAVFKAVGKTGRGVDHNAGGIHLAQEAAGQAVVLCHYAVGVHGGVGVDVAYGLVQIRHHFDG